MSAFTDADLKASTSDIPMEEMPTYQRRSLTLSPSRLGGWVASEWHGHPGAVQVHCCVAAEAQPPQGRDVRFVVAFLITLHSRQFWGAEPGLKQEGSFVPAERRRV